MLDMDLAQHPTIRGFAVKRDFGAVNSGKECFGDRIMLGFDEAAAVIKKMLENWKFGLFA
jgi:hypothetical protein